MSFASVAGAPNATAAATPRWSDLYIAALARAVSGCGDMLAATALALILVARGENGLAVAGILLAAAVPLVVVGPIAGRLADRVDSRTLIVSVGLVQVGVCVALAFATQLLQAIVDLDHTNGRPHPDGAKPAAPQDGRPGLPGRR